MPVSTTLPLDTPRLRLRPLTLADAPAIQRRFPRWDIVAFLNARVPWPYPENGAETYIRDIALPAMAERREWHWTLRFKDGAEGDRTDVLGVISLMRTEGDNRGFWLHPDWWGQGLMTEACAAVTAFWFEVLDQPVLRAPKAVGNIRSGRLSERTGMTLVGREDRPYVSGTHLSDIWELTRAQWRAQTSPSS
ncbi:MAG: GNAT family N-acetyltransferase [Rhodospirillum sp.]|nr:GNAT family N-acetyltransferase [Rhodospirillum sp.]MCF8488290.1 GNAT family N-acetyltransferase [Rhodospirillum sp.]MCF8500054.1 GNAT family N-acetyltransferase [Rhodospirillum sp.]